MNDRTFLLKLLFAIVLASAGACQQNQQPLQTHSRIDHNTSDATVSAVAGAAPRTTVSLLSLVNENFEQTTGGKSSYAASALTFGSGTWILDDALLGGSKADAKNGSFAVRLRNTGKLSMEFDTKSATSISVFHGAYGTDGASNWQLWESIDRGRTYQQVGVTVSTISHQLSEAIFHTNLGTQQVRLEIRKISGGKNRLDIDDITIKGGGLAVPQNSALPQKRIQDTTDRESGLVNLLLGNPSKAASSTNNADNYLINQIYYVESYNRTRAVPNWVSWHIGSADLGSTDRLNNFRPDTNLPPGWYEVDNTSYKGSGFDKGHNCPSGDRTSSTAANASTFLMDNMIPQAANNNQHTWEHLESYCRMQVKKGFEVYVVMGSYGSGGTGKNGYVTSIDQMRINVPAHIWKVVVILPEGENDLQRINANTTVIAVNTPNDDKISADWMKYTCSVRDIEKATGYNLLSALPQAVQDILEIHTFRGGN